MNVERVVVTGIGLVTPLGVGLQRNWQRLLAGANGIRLLTDDRYARLPCRLAATVDDKDVPKPNDRVSRAQSFAVLAAREAWADAHMQDASLNRDDIGVAYGQGMVDLDDIHRVGTLIDGGDARRVSPFFVPRLLANSAAGLISIEHKLRGPNHCVSTACTTGAHAVGDAYNFIRLRMANVCVLRVRVPPVQAMLCGAGDACISPISLVGFSRCRALATGFDEHPSTASRPFDKNRRGFVIGEGAGVIVLESLSHALARGNARIYAEVLGYGLSGDAHHATAPDEHGTGARLCMQRALPPNTHVGYVNAHATSTPLGDQIEARAIETVCGTGVRVSSTKGATGHLLGGAGAVEAAFTVMAVHTGQLPPTLNLDSPDFDTGLTLLKTAVDWPDDGRRRVALTNSFGFGGTNAALCFAQFVH